MNVNNLNRWLALAANVGVLGGIVFVGLELQQTRAAIVSDIHSGRAESYNNIIQMSIDIDVESLFLKLDNGEELTVNERNSIRVFATKQLRHLENLYFQRQLGLVDDELWAANLRSISAVSNSRPFNFTWPNWPKTEHGLRPDSFRDSFVELVSSLREQ